MENSYAGAAEGSTNSSKTGLLWWEVLLAVIIVPLFLGLIAGTSLLLGQASVNIPPEVLDIDIRLYRAAVALRDPRLTGVVFTLFNDPGVDYTVLIAACLGYVWWKRRRDMVGAVAAVGLTLVVGAWTIPYTHQFGLRPRPFMVLPEVVIDPTWREIWTYNPTFPSGHVRELAGLGVVLSYFWPRARWFALPYVGFIAFSRVYIGAHFPTDVFAGLFIGVLAGAFSVIAVGHRDALFRRRVAHGRGGHPGDRAPHGQVCDFPRPADSAIELERPGHLGGPRCKSGASAGGRAHP